jgi:threonine aldolase
MADKPFDKTPEPVTHPIVDLRSDTVTQPDAGMREAMARAVVGDDVFRDDPTVLALEERVAAMLGKEAALFFPSGTMSNSAALRVHTHPGDEVLCEEWCHIFNYESGHAAAISGVQLHPVRGHRGALSPEQLKFKVRPKNVHYPQTRLIAVENTHNRHGGAVIPVASMKALWEWSREALIPVHIDGARLWNASVALGEPIKSLAQYGDTVSVCLSKGLGAPAGSLLCGPRALIDAALRARKMLGGAMRQAGVLAAAGMYALDNNLPLLAVDHAHAKKFATALSAMPHLDVKPSEVETNIVMIGVEAPWTSHQLAAVLGEYGVRVGPTNDTTIRAVTNLGIDNAGINRAVEVFAAVTGAEPPEPAKTDF